MQVLLAALCILLFVVCDTFAAQWAKTGKLSLIVSGTVIAVLGYITFAWLNKQWPLAQAGIFVNVGIALGSVLVGYFFFKEQLATIQWWGIGLGLVALYMVCGGGK